MSDPLTIDPHSMQLLAQDLSIAIQESISQAVDPAALAAALVTEWQKARVPMALTETPGGWTVALSDGTLYHLENWHGEDYEWEPPAAGRPPRGSRSVKPAAPPAEPPPPKGEAINVSGWTIQRGEHPAYGICWEAVREGEVDGAPDSGPQPYVHAPTLTELLEEMQAWEELPPLHVERGHATPGAARLLPDPADRTDK